jgi:hypothetical protein
VGNAPTIDQLTLPMTQWPRPATIVRGTAWAKSEPTTRTGGSRGYRKKSTATPKAPAPTEHRETNTPSSAPKTTVIEPAYLTRAGSSNQRRTDRDRDESRRRWALLRQQRQCPDCNPRGWHRANCQNASQTPRHMTLLCMNECADRLGQRRIHEIGSNRGKRVHSEKQYENRGHQRNAAHPRETDDCTYDKT